MAGNYPDVPAPRMPYDRDGSVVLIGTTQQTAAIMVALNDENASTAASAVSGGTPLTFVFPQLRDLVAVYAQSNSGSIGLVQVSSNTTNGTDGTWTTYAADFSDGSGAYRNEIQSAAAAGINGIRFYGVSGVAFTPVSVHLYGTIATGQTPDRLSFWHPTTDVELSGAFFDFGDIPRGGVVTKQFRLKNRSTSLTAGGITVTDEILTDTTPALAPQYTYSTDNTTYTDTLTVGSLAPNTITSIYYMRLTKPADASLGLWVARHNAVATTFA